MHRQLICCSLLILFSFRCCLLLQVSRPPEAASGILRRSSCFCVHQQIAACRHDQGGLQLCVGRRRSCISDSKSVTQRAPNLPCRNVSTQSLKLCLKLVWMKCLGMTRCVCVNCCTRTMLTEVEGVAIDRLTPTDMKRSGHHVAPTMRT